MEIVKVWFIGMSEKCKCFFSVLYDAEFNPRVAVDFKNIQFKCTKTLEFVDHKKAYPTRESNQRHVANINVVWRDGLNHSVIVTVLAVFLT